MRKRTPAMAVATAIAIVGALFVARPLPAHAGSFTVVSNSDGASATCGSFGTGTLRDCIGAANTAGGTNTITFDPSVTSPIVLASGELHITGSQTLTITGRGQAVTVIDGNAASRVFETDSGTTVTMTDLTVRNGKFTNPSGFEGGGGIRNGGTLTLDRVTVSGNQALAASGVSATSGGVRDVDNAVITIRHSTFTGNIASSDHDAAGGALQDCCTGGSNVSISDSVFSGNLATTTTGQAYGGALAIHGTAQIVRTAFNDNTTTQTDTGSGNGTGSGAIVSHGTVTLDHTTFHHNTSTGAFGFASAGAVDICCGRAPSLTVTNSSFDHNATTGASGADAGAVEICCGAVGSIATSTFDSNTTSGPGAIGGAVTVDTHVNGATIPIVNSTFTGNAASGDGSVGGAIGLSSSQGSRSPVVLTNDTIDKNTAASGPNIFVGNSETLQVVNTIVAGSPSGNCSVAQGGTLTDVGHNLDDGSPSTCGFSTAKADILGADPKADSLGSNGGPTRTQALLPGSPAIDTASNSACPATDERGFPRFPTGDATCDIGAFEVQPVTPGLPAAGMPSLPWVFDIGWLTLTLVMALLVGAVSWEGRRRRQ